MPFASQRKFIFRSIRISIACALLTLIAANAVVAQSSKPVKPGQRTPGQRSSAGFDSLARRATEAREADRLEESIALYLQALRLKPSWKEGWWYAATLFYERDGYREARDAFRNFVKLDDKFGPAWTMMGLCEFQLKEYNEAIGHLRRGLALGLGDNREMWLVSRYHEAILLNRFEMFEQAYDALSRLTVEQYETPDLIVALGLTMLRLPHLPSEAPPGKREMILKAGRAAHLALTKRIDEAAGEFKELVEIFPGAPGVHYARGVFLLRDTPAAALEEFERELAISPQHVAARLQIAFEYIKRNEHAKGLRHAEEAVKLAPGLFAGHNALGRILLETGEIDRAVAELETGVKLAPDSPEMYFALARAYARAGRTKDAERARAEFTRLDSRRRDRDEGRAGSAAKPPGNDE
jgi:tetratricopeptide (TPR) repeat protein